jgi:acyl transferase domain-containing protein
VSSEYPARVLDIFFNVKVSLNPAVLRKFSPNDIRLFSEEGKSFSFDSRGTGYGRGEGCGIVILKPLSRALEDNDVIRSVIVASGVNQDGRTPGITMPNGSAQGTVTRHYF